MKKLWVVPSTETQISAETYSANESEVWSETSSDLLTDIWYVIKAENSKQQHLLAYNGSDYPYSKCLTTCKISDI